MSAYTLLWCLTVLLEACSIRAQHSETRVHGTYGLDVRQDGAVRLPQSLGQPAGRRLHPRGTDADARTAPVV
jgi:hypothetical protein